MFRRTFLANLPPHALAGAAATSARAENPNRKGMLFAGTGHGFYYTLDDGVKLGMQ